MHTVREITATALSAALVDKSRPAPISTPYGDEGGGGDVIPSSHSG